MFLNKTKQNKNKKYHPILIFFVGFGAFFFWRVKHPAKHRSDFDSFQRLNLGDPCRFVEPGGVP